MKARVGRLRRTADSYAALRSARTAEWAADLSAAADALEAAWQRSQPVEVTEEMVERAARALYADSPLALYDERAGLITGAKPWEWLTPEYQDARRADARIALSAALGGEGR